jgi:hypothetical protein
LIGLKTYLNANCMTLALEGVAAVGPVEFWEVVI